MTINFRRNALQLSVAALFSSAFMANAAVKAKFAG